MAKQDINLGIAPTGAGGDDRRSAWTKAKSNFTELYDFLAGTANATALPANFATALNNAGAYRRANVLGTVSQSGGVPTGGLLEFGSNSNGSYLKFADGTLICYFYTSTGYPLNTLYGNCYVSVSLQFPFPHAFAANRGVPALTPFAITPGAAIVWGATEGMAGTTTAVMRLVSPAQVSSYAGYIAIGRWY